MKIFKSLTFVFFLSFSVFAQTEEGFQQRAKQIIDHTADSYTPPSKDIGDPEKYHWPIVIARFNKYGTQDEQAVSYIKEFKDRSPFHFTLIGMARIMGAYGGAPIMSELAPQYLAKVFERSDSYNAFTCEGTENHISMSRTSGYLYAQYFDKYTHKEGQSKKDEMRRMERWLQVWAKQLYEKGNGEWNSSIYEVYNIIGWLNVYDFAKDPEIKNYARAVLDYYATEVALHNSWGLPGGSEMRANGVGNNLGSGYAMLSWLWFGDGVSHNFEDYKAEYIQLVHFATSSYRPPMELNAIARKQVKSPKLYYNSRPDYLISEKDYIKQYFRVDKSYTLGVSALPYGGYSGASMQLMPWKIVSKGAIPEKPLDISGNGRFYNQWDCKARCPLTQFVGTGNMLAQMTFYPPLFTKDYKLVKAKMVEWQDLWKADFTERWYSDDEKLRHKVVNFARPISSSSSYISLPKEAKLTKQGKFYIAELPNTTLSLYPIDGRNTFTTTKMNRTVLVDSGDYAYMYGFVIEVYNNEDIPNKAAFIASLGSKLKLDKTRATSDFVITYTNSKGETATFEYEKEGSFKEPLVDWGFGPKKPSEFQTSPPFEQPEWPSGPGYGKIARVNYKGKKYPDDETHLIFNGPDLKLEGGILTIKGEKTTYKVDFSNDSPVFP